MGPEEEAFWVTVGFGVVALACIILLDRPGGAYTPTRYTLMKRWLAAWFKNASSGRHIELLMSNGEEEEDISEPVSVSESPVSGLKRNDEIGITEPKQPETDFYSVSEAEMAFQAVARLVMVKPKLGGLTITEIVEQAFDVKRGGSKEYKAATEGVYAALGLLEQERKEEAEKAKFPPLDEQGKPVAITKRPPRRRFVPR